MNGIVHLLPLRNICFNPTPSYCHSSVIDTGRYFFNLFYTLMWYCVTVPTLEFHYLYNYITLTFFSVLLPSHFILALSCVLSTVVLVNEYERMNWTIAITQELSII